MLHINYVCTIISYHSIMRSIILYNVGLVEVDRDRLRAVLPDRVGNINEMLKLINNVDFKLYMQILYT